LTTCSPVEEVDLLRKAIAVYAFPLVTFDFAAGGEIEHGGPRELELAIREKLLSGSPEEVKDGLSNVLHWGFARIAFGRKRVARFREKVTAEKLSAAGALFRGLSGVGLIEIKKLGLPQFSMMPFVSKIRMFLDPANFVTLDNKLAKLKGQAPIFEDLSKGQKATTIGITGPNEAVYERWCAACRRSALLLEDPAIIAADVERAIFQLVDDGDVNSAEQIVRFLATV